MSKPFVHTRDVSCPTCGEPAASPCRLRNGEPLSDLHCTDRITKASGAEPLTPPAPPYTPAAHRASQDPPRTPAKERRPRNEAPALQEGSREGPQHGPHHEPPGSTTPSETASAPGPARRRPGFPSSRKPAPDPEVMPALF